MKRSYSARSLMIFVSVFMLSLCGGGSSAQAAKKSRTIATIKEANGQVCFKIQSYASKKRDKKIEFLLDGKAVSLSDIEGHTAEDISQIILYQEELKIDFRHQHITLDSLKFMEFGCHHINGHSVKVYSTGRKLNFSVDCSHCIKPKFMGKDTDFFRNWFSEQLDNTKEIAHFYDGSEYFLFFRIDTDGNIHDIRITSESPNPFFTQYIQSIIEAAPKWSPASCGGVKHPSGIRLPIVFILRQKNPNPYSAQPL